MSYTADKDGVRNNASGHYIGQNRRGMAYRLNRMRRNMKKEKEYQKALKDRDAMPLSARREALAKGSTGKASRNVLAKKGGKKRRSRKSRKSRRKSRKSRRKSRKSNRRRTRRRRR